MVHSFRAVPSLFCFRNTSDERKSFIIADLERPLNHPLKTLKAVVATISLGVGVDVRVHSVVSFSLGATPEDTVQEAGRSMRGSVTEVGGKQGYAFFFQKGTLAAIHCKPSSECRQIITDPLPVCQTVTLYRFFQPDFVYQGSKCTCCYSCIRKDASSGCVTCTEFLDRYSFRRKSKRLSKSAMKSVKNGLQLLFDGMAMEKIPVESSLFMTTECFVKDFIRVYDEISSPRDICDLWHVDESLAESMLSVCEEVLWGTEDFSDSSECSDDEVDQNSSTDSCKSSSSEYSCGSGEDVDDGIIL